MSLKQFGLPFKHMTFATVADGHRSDDVMNGSAVMITAIVLVNTAQGRVPEVAQALIDLPGVTEAYSVAGPYDLVAIARVRHHEELEQLVAESIQSIPGIESTNTLIAFRAYSRRELEAMWDIGNES
jgi:DNA-binding Lrp family transcriptional regulator